jgi:Na+-transporting methylmalonyl-CoA/oxaloacetate decarboxylase gamma subunit
MTVPEGLLVMLFVMAVVFTVLFMLSGIIKILSKGLGRIGTKSEQKAVSEEAAAAIQNVSQDAEDDFSSGTLKLKKLDESTAAMIMAIVSDESGIPLSELVFKSISLREQKI